LNRTKKDIRVSQEEIRSWFDANYRRAGYSYLRPREAYPIFLKLLGLGRDQKILDVACGPGLLLSVAMDQRLEAHGVDISSEALKMCKSLLPRADVILANAEALPYPDKHFDGITCIGSLERFIDLERSLSEQIRVAKADARFCYLVRNANTFSWRVFVQLLGRQNVRGHQGAKTLAEWKGIFRRSGLEILHVCHDHWPILRLLRWIPIGNRFIDYGKRRKGLLPLKCANEFIFILKKRSPGHAA
jgi:SAM-dependent methyltransferase